MEQLLKHAFDVASALNCTTMHISIVEENEVVKQWYKSMGFVHTGIEKLDFFPFACGYMERDI